MWDDAYWAQSYWEVNYWGEIEAPSQEAERRLDIRYRRLGPTNVRIYVDRSR